MHTTLFLEHLTTLDYAFLDADLGVRGESLQVSAELDGEVDGQGFLVDFGRCKRILKAVVDEHVDHRLVVARGAPGLVMSTGAEGSVRLSYPFAGGELRYECPREAVAVVEGSAVDAPALTSPLTARARAELPANVQAVFLKLAAEPRFGGAASFRYTHGLKHHEGNCQRLLHGHSSRVEVCVDGVVDPRLSTNLASELAEAHFVHVRDVVDLAASGLVAGRRVTKLIGSASVRYQAPQGTFWAWLPKSRLVVLEHEPSVEHITAYAHALVCAQGIASERVAVTVYEGFGKGARCSAAGPARSATRQ